MSQFDIACVGDAKIDQFLFLHEASSHLKLNKETNELCLKYGEKIPVDDLKICLGGDGANVAVGLARLGLSTSLIAELGDDEFSQIIKDGLKKENIDLTFAKQITGKTSTSIIISFQNERTILSQHIKRGHNFEIDNLETKWIYLTSLGAEWELTYQKIYEFSKQKGVKLAFNPGTLQIDEGLKKLKNILTITDILFLNKEEATKILRINDKGLMINDLLNGLKQLGPKTVIITDGKNGSYAIDENGKILFQAIIPTEIIEKTGAGDAYASGFLAASLSNLPIQTAMKWGTLNACGTMSAVGAQNGLLSREKMEALNA
ncbi:MAG: carbohydrate kinase family protein [Candidatus Parcubacteria bacterium]|nr:carbohydrate kinase family protein [Candidatus Parcubacteria bacterium]